MKPITQQYEFLSALDNAIEARRVAYLACINMGWSANEALIIDTAVWEALVNAITHGSPHGERDQTTFTITTGPNHLHFEITSSDASFRLPDKVCMPSTDSSRGRGIPLICAIMDNVWLTSDENRVTLHMMKHIRSRKSVLAA